MCHRSVRCIPQIYTSTDDDDFRHPLVEIPAPIPFAYEPIDGDPAEYLPIVAIPAPIPLASYPAYELMPDADADGDIELYEDEPFEEIGRASCRERVSSPV